MRRILGSVFLNNSASDPQFVDLAGDDLHLLATSPGAGTGAAVVEPALDYYGMPYDTPRSKGAVEYQGSTTVEEAHVAPWRVFPNPVAEKLMVLLPFSGTARLDLYDAAGRPVGSALYGGAIAEMDVQHLAAGLYVLKVSMGNFAIVSGW